MSQVTALIADWGGAGEEVAESLEGMGERVLLPGARYVAEVNGRLADVKTPYTLLADGSGAFDGVLSSHAVPAGCMELQHAGVTAVTFALPGIETYGDLVPSGALFRTPWLAAHPLSTKLLSFGWERVLTLSCELVVTSNYVLRPVRNDSRQEALGVAYYDMIRDNNAVEQMCGL
jgi:hypothetical protein